MAILIKKAGLLDTFQDLGRAGFRRMGINPNGAMDKMSVRVGNILLGNRESETAIEMHFPAPVLKFLQPVSFVITGADFDPHLDGVPIELSRPHTSKKGNLLSFNRRISGNRCYLTVKNGFQLKEWLSSTSTNLAAGAGGYKGRKLVARDKISFCDPRTVAHRHAAFFRRSGGSEPRLRFVPGPDFADLTAKSELEFHDAVFLVGGDSNRMGYRLEGPRLDLLDNSERISSSVTCGTMQVLPDGRLILLMADHQTTGGYPNIGSVITSDIPIAAQLGNGDRFLFEKTSIAQAETAFDTFERDLAFLRTGLRLRT